MSILAAVAVPHPPIILPEVGQGEEKKIAKTSAAYHEVMQRVAALEPDTVVITSPHATMYSDYFHISPGKKATGDFAAFRAPEVQIEVDYDEAFAKTLAAKCMQEDLPAGFLGEREPSLDHGTMIPLYFLQPELKKPVKVVRIGLSGLSADVHYRFGELIRETAEELGRRVVFIASGDLSHKLKADGPYGFAKEGPVFDHDVTEALDRADFLSLLTISHDLAEGAAECGLRSFWIMTGALDRQKVAGELLSYEGTFGVGYGVAYLKPLSEDDSRDIGRQLLQKEKKDIEALRAKEDGYVHLARLSLETYVRSHVFLPVPKDLPEDLQDRQAGCFVSIKKEGRLRGCIGTLAPGRRNLAEEIICNAVSAGMHDPRFPQVTPEELPRLVYDVDVLSEPEPIDSPKQLDVKRYGVIVQCGERRGVLLPDLAGVDTAAQQIDIARRKGNIGAKEKYTLWRFEVTRHV
ncbi:AmmeMemoRadiSam system protein A [Mitsuokella sp. WILCCON 0060]|uniref:AmmeMemoRadiSam system protein A n=1 Tax=Mitsuokella sp. WILCCON 0060 TaxID=3345341 RepID=UPI003F1CC97D